MFYNRKASLDLPFYFPTIIIVVVLSILLVVLSSYFSGRVLQNSDKAFDSGNLLLERINLGGKEILIIDALLANRDGKIDRVDIENALKGKVSLKSPCFIVIAGDSENPASELKLVANEKAVIYFDKGFAFQFQGGRAEVKRDAAIYSMFSLYENKGLTKQKRVFLNDKKKYVYFEYYRGECIK